MSPNLVWQYTAVAVLILLAIARIIWGMRRKRKKGGGCSGCALAATCRDNKAASRATTKTPPRQCP